MPEPSSHALVCDLLGEDPYEERPRRLPVAEVARRCPRGRIAPARRGAEDVAVAVLEDGRRVVVPDRCPHDGGSISDGFIDGDRLVCARHGWEFDATTGECVGRPRARIEVEELDSPARKRH